MRKRCIHKCICHNIEFADLKQIAKKHDYKDIESLRENIEFGTGCGMCNPYIKLMLKTGQTEFNPHTYFLEHEIDD